MESNKLIETEKVKKKNHYLTDDLNDILPIDTVAAILGGFFTVCSIIYVLLRAYVPEEHVVLAISITAVVSFLAMWASFVVVAYLRRKRKAKETLMEQKEKLIEQLHFCRECSIKKINDGFAYRKLLKEKNIEDVEEKLAIDLNPRKCHVLVYTSDLATILRRWDLIERNIRDHGVNYRVVYFRDSTQNERSRIVAAIGENNLLNAVEPLKGTRDSEIMGFSDMELIIYLDSSSYIQGFFSVDNVPANAIAVGRSAHFPECTNRCNYGHSYQDGKVKSPFYKALNKEKTRTLYHALDSLFGGGNQ